MHIGLIIIILLALLLLWTMFEQKKLITTDYIIESDKLPIAFQNTKLVILSDLHNFEFGKNNEKLVRRVEELSPDFIIIAGDMINKTELCYPSNAYSLIEQLASKYNIYYAFGNHEQRQEKLLSAPFFADKKNISGSWIEYKKKLNEMKVVILNNKSILCEKENEKIRITGVSLHKRFFKHGSQLEMEEGYLESVIGVKPESIYNILIAHTPLYFHEYAKWGADLTISGHLHGGLIRLPYLGGVVSPQVMPFPKYDSGQHIEDGHTLIVSRGLGSHSMMPRVFNAPEIITLTLKNNQEVK